MDLSDLRFDEGHTWVKDDGKELLIGITDYAQDQLGDVIFIELPEVGAELVREDTFGSIESAKAVEDLVSPVSGTVTRRNDDLLDMPETVNQDAYGEGWLIAVKPDEDTDLGKLMAWEQYQKFLEVLDADELDDDDYGDDFDDDDDDDLFFDEEDD